MEEKLFEQYGESDEEELYYHEDSIYYDELLRILYRDHDEAN